MAKNQDTASVLAFEKKLVPSDGYMYGTQWDDRNNKSKQTPLELIEKSVRGTISNRLKAAIKSDPVKLNAEVEKANLQTVDSCALAPEQDTLKLHFTLKVLGGVHQPSACNNALFKQSYSSAVRDYIGKEGFKELGKRYALNLANARFLWRNRVGAENIEVQVNALTIPLRTLPPCILKKLVMLCAVLTLGILNLTMKKKQQVLLLLNLMAQ